MGKQGKKPINSNKVIAIAKEGWLDPVITDAEEKELVMQLEMLQNLFERVNDRMKDALIYNRMGVYDLYLQKKNILKDICEIEEKLDKKRRILWLESLKSRSE